MKNKRRLISLMVIITLLLGLLSSCVESDKSVKTSKDTNIASSTYNLNSAPSHEIIDYSSTAGAVTDDFEDVGGGTFKVQKYRDMFYSVPAPFVNLVGKEIFFEWRETIDATSTAETMVMSLFIQHFGITREQFDKANLEWAKGIRDNLDGIPCVNPKDYANQITDEVFNGDIIFTFDDDLIREYYLSPDYPYLYDYEFEQAVANGEYTSQTEEWVDVEAMEAEIIAKYGEAEIVTEDTTSIIEENTAAIPDETESAEQTEVIM